MKFLLVALVLLFAVWLWRRDRGDSDATTPPPPSKPKPPAEEPQDMVACRQCGLHLPQSDALPDGPDWACCEAHRSNVPH